MSAQYANFCRSQSLLLALLLGSIVGCGAKAEREMQAGRADDRASAAMQADVAYAEELPTADAADELAGDAPSHWAPLAGADSSSLMVEPPSTETTARSMAASDQTARGLVPALSPPASPLPDPAASAAVGSEDMPPSPDVESPDVESPVGSGGPPAELLLNTAEDHFGRSIEVFFATDRLPTAQLIPSTIRTFAPAGIVGMICCALFIGFSLARRFRAMWLIGSGLAVCLGITVLHTSIIRWQQYARLAHNASTRFSTLRDPSARDYPLHVGTATVSLPPTHRPGRFEQPKLFQFEFVETPKKHIVLHSLQVKESATWFDEISEASRCVDGQDGFVFIHGYNVRFIDALKRTAQLAHDLELEGPSICYSWPSRADVAAYTADEAAVSWSAPHFEQLLIDLHARTQCRRVNVIAHSMGNRALLEAIERIDLKTSGVRADEQPALKLIDTLVMAAPDVDMQLFATRYLQPLQNIVGRATLYFSDDDRALQLSAGIHGATRLGLGTSNLPSLAGIDAIHVETHGFLALGHSYYGDDPAVLQDLRDLLRDKKPASQRQLLRSVATASGVPYWQVDRTLYAQLSTSNQR